MTWIAYKMMQIDVVTQLLVVFHIAVKCPADAG